MVTVTEEINNNKKKATEAWSSIGDVMVVRFIFSLQQMSALIGRQWGKQTKWVRGCEDQGVGMRFKEPGLNFKKGHWENEWKAGNEAWFLFQRTHEAPSTDEWLQEMEGLMRPRMKTEERIRAQRRDGVRK